MLPSDVFVVLEDVTETDFIAQPSPEAMLSKLGLDHGPWQAVAFRYSTISDVSINKHFDTAIPAGYALLGNALERNKAVAKFKHDIDSVLTRTPSNKAKTHSSIWLPLIRQIEDLQNDTESHTTIYLFSDLRENSQFWSSYRTADVQTLRRDFAHGKNHVSLSSEGG